MLNVYCMQLLENWAFCPSGHFNATFGFIYTCDELSKCPFPTEWENLKKNMIKKCSGMTNDIFTVWCTREDGPDMVSHVNLVALVVTSSIAGPTVSR